MKKETPATEIPDNEDDCLSDTDKVIIEALDDLDKRLEELLELLERKWNSEQS